MRYGKGGGRKEDAASGRAEKREHEDEDEHGEDRRTCSPTSVTDFALSAVGMGMGMGGNNFPGMQNRQSRNQQARYDDDGNSKPVGDGAASSSSSNSSSSSSGSGAGTEEEDGASKVAAAAPAGDATGGPGTSADFMSAQALFGESIPGLTSFGEYQVCFWCLFVAVAGTKCAEPKEGRDRHVLRMGVYVRYRITWIWG